MRESDPVWTLVGKLVGELFKCPIVLISSSEADQVVMLCRFGLTSNSSQSQPFASDKMFPTSRELLLLPDIFTDPRFTAGQQRVFFLEQEQVRFYLCVPLLDDGKKIGNLLMMDRMVRNDFDSDKKMFVNEVSIMLGTLLSDERCGLMNSLIAPLEKISLLSETRTVEHRVLSVLKLPLRNCSLLQKSLQEFHQFLVQQRGKSVKNGKSPIAIHPPRSTDEKTEHFHRIIDERRQLVLNSMELGRLSMKEYISQFSQYNRAGNAQTGRMRRQSCLTQTGNFLTVKEWMNSIQTYIKTASNSNSNLSQTKIDWFYEESSYAEIEDDDRFEIIGKIVEFTLLSSFHRWNTVLVNVSVSDERDDTRIETPGPLNNRENPFSDASHFSTKDTTKGFLNEPTGRMHIDIMTRPKEHQISRLVDEQKFYTACDEYANDLLMLLHGQSAKISRTVGILNDEKKTISIPCNIREKTINTPNFSKCEIERSDKTINLFQTEQKREEKLPSSPGENVFTRQLTDDIAQLHDLLEIYDTANMTTNEFSHDNNEDDDDKTFTKKCEDEDDPRMKKNVSMFRSTMFHGKNNKVVPSVETSTTSRTISTYFGNEQTKINVLAVDDSEREPPRSQQNADAIPNISTIGKLKTALRGYSLLPSNVTSASSQSTKSTKKLNQNQNQNNSLCSFFFSTLNGNKKEKAPKFRLKPVKADADTTRLPGNQASTFLSFSSRLCAQFQMFPTSSSPVRTARQKKSYGFRPRKIVSVERR